MRGLIFALILNINQYVDVLKYHILNKYIQNYESIKMFYKQSMLQTRVKLKLSQIKNIVNKGLNQSSAKSLNTQRKRRMQKRQRGRPLPLSSSFSTGRKDAPTLMSFPCTCLVYSSASHLIIQQVRNTSTIHTRPH